MQIAKLGASLIMLTISLSAGVCDPRQQRVPFASVEDDESDTSHVHRVVKLLEDCPKWVGVGVFDQSGREHIIRNFAEIAKENTETIREGEKIYMHAKHHRGLYDDDGESDNLRLLHGYLFNTPDKPDGSASMGKPLVPNSQNHSKDNVQLPFAKDASGHLRLIGHAEPRTGANYLYLFDFDYRHIMYGRREVDGAK